MNSVSIRTILSIAIAIVFSVRSPTPLRAAELVVAIQGEISDVTDNLNWFHNSLHVGMPVVGTYNFFDPGYLKEIYIGDPSEITYRYLLQPDPNFNVPVLPVNMHLAVGGHAYQTLGSAFGTYAISVFNDSNGFVVGDGYQVQSPLPFPAQFTDWTGDPVNDPDGFFSPYLFMTLDLRDPTATALSSTDLPSAPGLAGFATAVGHIYIADANGEPDYAVATFRILSLQVVPEPSSLAICAIGLVFVAAVRRRKGCVAFTLFSVAIALGLAASSAQADILYLGSQLAVNHQVVKINSIGAASDFASLPAGAVYPYGVAFDVSGNLYATDPNQNTITKITPAGTATLFKSLPGGSFPNGLAIDAGGNLYVANISLRQINKITSTGALSLFATLPGEAASSEGMAFDSDGNLYVSRTNGEIDKITSAGTVSLFATPPPGSGPIGLAFDGIGNLYAADGNSEKILRITPGGAVSLFATLPFPEAWGLAFGTGGILYATNLSGNVHKIAPDGTVSLFASVADESFLYLAVTDDAGHPLSVPPATLLGDYNRNGTVDAADYVVWRNGLGTIYNQADYQVWRNHFGQTSGGGSSASANAVVPEPSSLVICGIGFSLAVGCARRRCQFKRCI